MKVFQLQNVWLKIFWSRWACAAVEATPMSPGSFMAFDVAASCEFYRDSQRPAFSYYKLAANGSAIQVGPQSSPSGLCYFPDASCDVSDFTCCTLDQRVGEVAAKGEQINVFSLLACLVLPMCCWRRVLRIRNSYRHEEGSAEDEEAGTLEDDAAEKPSMSCWRPCLNKVFLWIFAFGLLLEMHVYMYTASITQELLSVPQRTSMLFAGAFLVPIREIFQFSEDVVVVKVVGAVAAGSMSAVRPIVALGVLGGALCGVAAALCATALSSWPAALRWLVSPYAMHSDYQACPLVPESDEAAKMAKMYLLLSVWCWPANFVSMTLRGLLMSQLELISFGIAKIVPNGLNYVLLFMVFVRHPSLDTLGLITIVCAYVELLILLVILAAKRDFRARFHLTLGCAEAEAAELLEVQTSWRDASRDGFYAMLLDLAAQCSITAGIYTGGAVLGIGAMYQIATLQAAFPQYGLIWIFALIYMVKVYGTPLVVAKTYSQFKGQLSGIIAYGFVLMVVSAITLMPYKVPIAFAQAQQACRYASSLECTNIFTDVFGGATNSETVQGSTMWTFVPILMAQCFYRLFKAALYACGDDWRFMASAGVASFIFIFLPAIGVAVLYFKNIVSIVTAMYLPSLVLAISFVCRTRQNINRMLSGEGRSSQED